MANSMVFIGCGGSAAEVLGSEEYQACWGAYMGCSWSMLKDGHRRCKRKNMKRLGGGGLPLHIFGNLKPNNSRKNAFIVWGAKGDEQVAAKKECLNISRHLKQSLEPYYGGEVFGFLDVALMGYYSWFKAMEKFGEFSIGTEFPKLTEWTKRG
ncbi:hypothetical protein Rs2_21928 [Raphanus sativus]|nr:hypothetical protein Rs2_21928 [Raphanus sativus]